MRIGAERIDFIKKRSDITSKTDTTVSTGNKSYQGNPDLYGRKEIFRIVTKFQAVERNLGDRRVQDVLDRVLSVHHSGAVEELSLVLLQEAMTSRLTRKLRILH